MQIRRLSLLNRYSAVDPCVTVLGSFDGLHLGHQALIKEAKELATAQTKGVLRAVTFSPHPIERLTGIKIPRLMGLHQRYRQAAALGVTELSILRFSRAMSELSAEQFIKEIIIKQLNTKIFLIGPDARIGKGARGEPELIKEICAASGIAAVIMPFKRGEIDGGELKISSRLIRQLLEAGKIESANSLLGYPYSVRGRVVRGDGRGSQIGYPTANLMLPTMAFGSKQMTPALGVYAAYFTVLGRRWPAVVNVGLRPTFTAGLKGIEPRIEVHILQKIDQNLRGVWGELDFVWRLRPERKFADLAALTKQIGLDVEEARAKLCRY